MRQVKTDMAEIKLQLSEAEIKSLSKCQFQVIVKKKIDRLAIEHLLIKRKQKCIELNLTKFKPQEYLLSRNSLIDVKENFRSSHENNMWCRTCSMFSETQQHLIDCSAFQERVRGLIDFHNLDVGMAFKSIINQEKLAKNYTIIFNARSEILACGTGDQ